MHPNERDLYKKVAVNAALIKTQICGLAPTICSWQFARPKDGKKSVQGLDEIGSSDVVGQLSSLALGIRESESAETIKQRTLTKVYGHHAQDDLGAWCRK